MARDEIAWQAAEEISAVANKGEDIVRDATKRAFEKMPEMLRYFDTKGGKIEALRAHGIYMGVAAQLANNTLPKAAQMKKDLTEIAGEKTAEIMTDLWLAKIVRDIVKGVKEYEQE